MSAEKETTCQSSRGRSTGILRLLGLIGLVVLTALPALSQLLFIHSYAIDVPVWEQWYFVREWDTFLSGGNWIRGLFHSYWGHYGPFPQLVFLMLGSLTRWSVLPEMYLGWGLLVGLLLVYTIWLRRLGPRFLVLAPLLSVILFSVKSAAVILNGFNSCIYMALLLSAMTIELFSRREVGLRIVVVALLLTSLATYSWGSGLLLWPAAGVFLLCRGAIRVRVRNTLVWAIGAVLTYLSFWSLSRGSAILSLSFFPSREDIQFAAAVLGNPFTGTISVVYALGLGMLTTVTVALYLKARVNPLQTVSCPWVGVGLQTILVVLLVSLVRSYDLSLAIYGQYSIVAIQLVIALLVLFADAVYLLTSRNSSGVLAQLPISIPMLLALACALLITKESIGNYLLIRGWHPIRHSLEEFLYRAPSLATEGQFLGIVSNEPEMVERGLVIMRKHHLGPFRTDFPEYGLPQIIPPGDANRQSGEIQASVDGVAMNEYGFVVIEGWAIDSATMQTPPYIFVGRHESVVEMAITGLPRPDIAAVFQSEEALTTGWMIKIPLQKLHRMERPLEVTFVASDGLRRIIPVAEALLQDMEYAGSGPTKIREF